MFLAQGISQAAPIGAKQLVNLREIRFEAWVVERWQLSGGTMLRYCFLKHARVDEGQRLYTPLGYAELAKEEIPNLLYTRVGIRRELLGRLRHRGRFGGIERSEQFDCSR